MKKTLLTLALLGLAAGLHAGPVTPEKAMKVAEQVLSAHSTKAAGQLHLVWDGETADTKADAPAFYVIGRDSGGFVMVAGDDNVRPVLALSYSNPFKVEGMPENVRYWMNKIKRHVRSAQTATPAITAQWEAFEQTKSEQRPDASVTQLSTLPFTVQWNQTDPANLLCPIVTGERERSVCGCVPLAIAEIMTWFGYPEKGSGTVKEYVTNEGESNAFTIEAHELGTVYDWTNLQDLYTPQQFYAETNTELGRNLGQLLYDVGTLLQVGYSMNGTGGTLGYLVSELSQHMGYSLNAIERSRGNFLEWKWDQMLMDQLDLHPIYYSGYDYADSDNPADWNGHAYVIDGYGLYQNTDNVFHFNFGWGGACNGWYSSDYQYLSDYGYRFEDVTALFDFVPDPGRQTDYLYELSYYGNTGLRAEREKNSLTLKGYDIVNTGSGTFAGYMNVFSLDKDGVRKDQSWPGFYIPENYNLVPNAGWYGSALNITVDTGNANLVLGDKLAYYYMEENGTDFKKLKHAADAPTVVTEQPAFPAPFIGTETSYAVNDYFYFRLTNHDFNYEDAVWKITDPAGNTETYDQDKDRVQLTRAGKYTIKVTPAEGGETIVAVINVN